MAPTYAEGQKKMELRNKALAANAAELPFLEPKRLRLNEALEEVRSLMAEQANLQARKQEVSKRLAELMEEGNKLVAFLDAGVRQHYGTRAEKLVEFGLQPFRGRPRLGPDGKRVKRPKASEAPPAKEAPVAEPPAQPATP
ncbi:MAG TPA: hypothetical protein VFW62_13120 [bacterium]|nr:hypothetical protein [bacterium]